VPLARGTRLGVYEIVAPLGAGGMGEVYRAHDLRLGRDVAIKILPEALASSPDRLARLEREARTVAGLNHPNIVVLHSIEEQGDTRFLTMELVEGRDLTTLISPGGLPLAEVLDVAIPLTDAMVAAHQRRVVHRDLKPANVMLTHDGRVKVLDFGLAKLVEAGSDLDLTRAASTAISDPGQVVGTLSYMAPEQIRGGRVDARADLFSFGVLVYELATGKRPFEGRTFADVSSAILRDRVPSLTSVRADLPGEFERIVERCLEKDPGARYQTAFDVGSELRDLKRTLERGVEPPAKTAEDRASIAVLPFDNLSGDPSQEYFADGIVEEIITGLSRIKWLFVISRNSTFIYKGKQVDVKTVGRELGVRYVLRGSVRRSGDQVRLTGQLAAAETAVQVWAGRYDGTLGDIFTLQDDLTMSVISAVEPTLRKAEVERARRKRPESLDAYDLFLRALPIAAAAMPDDAQRALGLLERAIRLEPDYAAVHGFMAWCHEQLYLRAGLHVESREAALRHAYAALETGSDDALALAMGGFVIGMLARNYDVALDALDRSLALSPSSALAFGFSSVIRMWNGEDQTAIEHAKMGIRLGPYDPLIYLSYVGLAYAQFFSGNFVESASAATRAAAANPRFSVPRYQHAAALVRLGQLEAAKAAAKVLLELQPGFTISGLVSGNIGSPERLAVLADALRDAGLPE